MNHGSFFTSERDGYLWLQSLEYSKERDQVYYDKWKTNLAIAEITGYNTYCAVIKAFKNPLPRWKGLSLDRYIYHASKIAEQEAKHYHMVAGALNVSANPVDHEATFAELDVNERRSEMRLTTIISSSSDKELVSLASRLMVDEAYHCWFTRLVLAELGDFDLPRL